MFTEYKLSTRDTMIRASMLVAVTALTAAAELLYIATTKQESVAQYFTQHLYYYLCLSIALITVVLAYATLRWPRSVSVDDAGIRLDYLFSSKHIPWVMLDAVTVFLGKDKPWAIRLRVGQSTYDVFNVQRMDALRDCLAAGLQIGSVTEWRSRLASYGLLVGALVVCPLVFAGYFCFRVFFGS